MILVDCIGAYLPTNDSTINSNTGREWGGSSNLAIIPQFLTYNNQMMGDRNMRQWKAGFYFVLGTRHDESSLLNFGLKLQATPACPNKMNHTTIKWSKIAIRANRGRGAGTVYFWGGKNESVSFSSYFRGWNCWPQQARLGIDVWVHAKLQYRWDVFIKESINVYKCLQESKNINRTLGMAPGVAPIIFSACSS